MSKTIRTGSLATLIAFTLVFGAACDSGKREATEDVAAGGHPGAYGDHGGHGGHGSHGADTERASSLADAWAAVSAARDAIASDVESGQLAKVHARAEPLPKLAGALLAWSGDLEPGKRARVEGAVKQVPRLADALHEAADRGDASQTRTVLGRLDGLLELIRAQYPPDALKGGTPAHEGHSAAPGHGHGAHAHAERPLGVVDAAPQATLHIEAFDELRFEPRRIELRAGVPTRIELVNVGSAEHSLVVKAPDGQRDWVHLHAPARGTVAATYQLDAPGTYPVLCTIAGHTEGGMVGELVVRAGPGPAHPGH